MFLLSASASVKVLPLFGQSETKGFLLCSARVMKHCCSIDIISEKFAKIATS